MKPILGQDFVLRGVVPYSDSYLFTKVMKGDPVQLDAGLLVTWILCFGLTVLVSVVGFYLKVQSLSNFYKPALISSCGGSVPYPRAHKRATIAIRRIQVKVGIGGSL